MKEKHSPIKKQELIVSEHYFVSALSHAFDPNELYNRVVHYYIDKKGYSKEQANEIARKVVEREKTRYTCKNANCGHGMYDHIRHSETCLVLDCECRQFVS